MSNLNLRRDSFITILSTRRSGKSYLVANLIHYFLTNSENRCDFLYMFSNTAKFEQGGNYNFIDNKVKFKADPENAKKIVDAIFRTQLETRKKFHILVIFDDIDLSKRYEDSIEKLATFGRHYHITTILSAQVATNAISPAIRNNTSYLFFRKLNAETIKKQIYSMIINGEFEHPQELYDYVQNNIQNYQFIFFDNDSDSKEIEIVKADPIPEGFIYKVKSPEKVDKTPKRPVGWGPPMNLTYFDSEGNAIRKSRPIL